jgi:hypothetical protein
MPTYDASHYFPPAPVAHVTLRDINSAAVIPNVILLIDTGADITLLPRSATEKLGLKPLSGQEYQLRGFDGTPRVVEGVELDMIFLRKAFRGRYLLIDGEHGVLGRDVLSTFVLLFDGPKNEWSEVEVK